MSTSNAMRFLADAGDDDALALEMFYGTVLESFYTKTILWNTIGPEGVGADQIPQQIVSSKIIDSGKSWQFPIIGKDSDPEYHTPGTELYGQQLEVDEGTVTIDKPLVKHYDLPIDQLQKAHWDMMAPTGRKVGRALATDFDKKLIIVGLKAATRPAVTKNGLTIHNGGNIVQRSNASGVTGAYPVSTTGAQNFMDDVAALGEKMDEDNVPEEGRFLMVTPYIRRVLSQAPERLFSRDYLADVNNNLHRRTITMIHGFQLVGPTNQMPNSNITTGPAHYQGDFTAGGSGDGEPVALALCGADEGEGAIGYVAASNPELGPIYTAMEFDERRNTWFIKGQMMVGADPLAPWCAGGLFVTT